MLYLAHKVAKTLSVYKIPINANIISEQTLGLCLSQTIQDFNYKDYLSYYRVGDSLNFLEDGNMISLNIQTGKRFTLDCGGYLT